GLPGGSPLPWLPAHISGGVLLNSVFTGCPGAGYERWKPLSFHIHTSPRPPASPHSAPASQSGGLDEKSSAVSPVMSSGTRVWLHAPFSNLQASPCPAIWSAGPPGGSDGRGGGALAAQSTSRRG